MRLFYKISRSPPPPKLTDIITWRDIGRLHNLTDSAKGYSLYRQAPHRTDVITWRDIGRPHRLTDSLKGYSLYRQAPQYHRRNNVA